eukprot:1162060-Pelagomonas_calceolata.AAC.5
METARFCCPPAAGVYKEPVQVAVQASVCLSALMAHKDNRLCCSPAAGGSSEPAQMAAQAAVCLSALMTHEKKNALLLTCRRWLLRACSNGNPSSCVPQCPHDP